MQPFVIGYNLPIFIAVFSLMITISDARKLALSFPEVIELPHFHLASFRANEKIFATLWEKEKRMMVKLSPVDQSVFCDLNKGVIYPVPNKWGLQGATFVELQKVKKGVLKDAIECAYCLAVKKPNKKKDEK